MIEKVTQNLKQLETKLFFIQKEIPDKLMTKNDVEWMIDDISHEIEKNIKILQEKKVESNILVN